ncbi:hypothetical protein HDV05_001548 [Chytridiales sp. JEL 0842]|nr:hypothetical protein HDV05_001548 [Chytridiales sp. JEL 0842]
MAAIMLTQTSHTPTSLPLSKSHPHTATSATNNTTLHAQLSQLNSDIIALKKHGDPTFEKVQEVAERTWKLNMEYDIYISRLEREKKELNTLIDHTWTHFDTLLQPLWRVDDSLVPCYNSLAHLRIDLESLLKEVKGRMVAVRDLKKWEAEKEALEKRLVDLQAGVRNVETEWVANGKFRVPPTSSSNSTTTTTKVDEEKRTLHLKASISNPKIPSGQAFLFSLLSKCFKLSAKIQDALETPLDSGKIYMSTLLSELKAVYTRLESLLSLLKSGVHVEPQELGELQTRLDALDSLRKDGKWETAEGTVPGGQAESVGMLESGYELVHECLVYLESQEEEEDGEKAVEVEVEKEVAKVRDAVLGIVFGRSAFDLDSSAEEAIDYTQDSDDDDLREERPHQQSTLSMLSNTLSSTIRQLRLPSTTTSSTTKPTTLTSALTSAISALRTSIGFSNEPAPSSSLEPIRARLLTLRERLVELQRSRDRLALQKLKGQPTEENADAGQRLEIRTHWVTLEELEEQRDADGWFVDEKTGKAVKDAGLKMLIEECWIRMWELQGGELREGVISGTEA